MCISYLSCPQSSILYIEIHILNMVYSFLHTFNDDLEDIFLHDNVITIRKDREYQVGLQERRRDAKLDPQFKLS
jgi:hypothetical protein